MCVVFSPVIEDNRQQTYDKVSKMITDHGGEIVGEEDWGMKTFAYPIQKNKHGFYSFYYIKADPTLPKEMAKLFKMDEEILRHMVIKRTIGKDIDLSRFNKKDDTFDIPKSDFIETLEKPLEEAPVPIEAPPVVENETPEIIEMAETTPENIEVAPIADPIPEVVEQAAVPTEAEVAPIEAVVPKEAEVVSEKPELSPEKTDLPNDDESEPKKDGE